MRRPDTKRRAQLRILALLTAALAAVAVVVEPFPKGFILLSITPTHGIDAGDLPAVLLLLVAAWLTIRSSSICPG